MTTLATTLASLTRSTAMVPFSSPTSTRRRNGKCIAMTMTWYSPKTASRPTTILKPPLLNAR
eukprot:384904-Pleurochrysis_carterae.AAC.1